jgi:hypothetical protein
MDSISRPGVATRVVESKSLARHVPRVRLLSSSSSTIPPSPAARDLHSVSPLNDITTFEVPKNVFFTQQNPLSRYASSSRSSGNFLLFLLIKYLL